MKRKLFDLKSLIAAATLAGCWIAPAAAQTDAFYAQLDSGLAILGDNEVGGAEVTFEDGFVVGARLGARVAPHFRIELEAAYAENEFDELGGVSLGSVGLDADLAVITFGAGAYVDLIQAGAFRPYLGAGIGGAYKDLDTNFGEDDQSTDLTAHGEVGIAVHITPHIAVVPHYRLVWLDNVGDDEQFAHWFRVGLRVSG